MVAVLSLCLCRQWGFGTVNANRQATTFTYPVAFNNAWEGFVQHSNSENVYHGFSLTLNKSTARVFIDAIASANTGFFIIIVGQ